MLLADPEPSATKAKLQELLKANPGNEQQIKDEFLYTCARRYFEVITAALRRHDPNHLVLGIRFAENPNNRWVEMSRMFDVFSVNIYSGAVHAGRGEHQALFRGLRQAGADRRVYRLHARAAACRACSTGSTRCATTTNEARRTATTWRTRPPARTSSAPTGSRWSMTCPPDRPSDEERLNYGFINVIDLPYPDLVAAAKETHRRIYDLKAGKAQPYAEKPRYN